MPDTTLEIIIAGRDQFSGTANKVVGSMGRIQSSAGRVSRGVGQVAGGLGRLGVVAGAAAIGGIAASTKAAIDYEDAFAGVRKTLDASPEELDEVSAAFRKLATEIPITATELARIGEVSGQLGIKADEMSDFVETVAELGVAAPKLGTEQAAFGLARILTLTGQTTDSADELASAIVDLGNNFATTEPAIVETAQRFASVANAAGISTQGVLALATATTALGGEPQEAGTSLQRAIQRITLAVSEGGEKLELFGTTSGLTAETFAKKWEQDALGTLQLFLAGLGDIDSNVRRTRVLDELGLSDARLGKNILNLASALDLTNDAIDTSNDAWDENTALSEEAEKRFDTLRSKLTVVKNNLLEAAMVIGEGVTPAIGNMAEKLTEFLQDPRNITALRNFGEDIGDAIDSIDWDAVLQGAKDVWAVIKDIWNLFNSLPTEIKVAGAALATAFNAPVVGPALQGITAGVGNIAGGIGSVATRSAGSRLPGGVGRLFAQPVFVTNWPVGGALGATGAGGGSSLLGKVAKVAIVGSVVVAGLQAWMDSFSPFVQRNQDLEDQGLSRPQREAYNYYTADEQTQTMIFKRLGRVPDKDDYIAAQAVLSGAMDNQTAAFADLRAQARDSDRILKGIQEDGARVIGSAMAESRAAAQESNRILRMIRDKDTSVNVTVNPKISLQQTNKTSYVTKKYGSSYGPPGETPTPGSSTGSTQSWDFYDPFA